VGKQKVTIMIGESGSGKSTKARLLVEEAGKNNPTVRINRDDIRAMFHLDSGKRELEDLVIKTQTDSAHYAIKNGFSVIIDDTNLNPKTIAKWESFAAQNKVQCETHRMQTDLTTCIQQDASRQGKSKVGSAVIQRQFLQSGRVQFSDKPIVLVDVDGTLADSTGVRSVYDESRVIHDKTHPEIVNQVRGLSVDHEIVIVSGRHSSCGDDTINWMRIHAVPYNHMFMRHGWDNRNDTVVKQEILDQILLLFPKERIVLVIDDRPSVLNMWHSNGLNIQPARALTEPF
jgi:predicted kinase